MKKFRKARGPMMLVMQIDHHQKRKGKDDAAPEAPRGRNEWLPDQDMAQLEILDRQDDRSVDRAAYDEVGRERKATEPHPHRTFQHELRYAAKGETENQPV
jgi:hypothetical protein